jgi:Fic family protein
MTEIFLPPELDSHDESVLAEIEQMRRQLSGALRAPRRWQGTLRRSSQARAIRGSNSIEGYRVSVEDAGAAVDGEPSLRATKETWAEIQGYRRVLTYVLNVATAPQFRLDEGIVQSMHFMLLEHDLVKSPGRYRTGPVYVTGDNQTTAYTAPDADQVPSLMSALLRQVKDGDSPTLVTAAMAHLNLVMIHPFRDGNGRMGRALQTLVLAMNHVLEPEFSSIEEWLGANSQDYFAVLAATGAGAWHPERSARLWTQFNLRAHHMQAQTVQRRFAEAGEQWNAIDDLVAANRLPERVSDALFDALLGFRVTRPSYISRVGIDERQATRDLARMSDLGLLFANGATKARHYTAGAQLDAIRERLRLARQPLTDPYPTLMLAIRTEESRTRVNDAAPDSACCNGGDTNP